MNEEELNNENSNEQSNENEKMVRDGSNLAKDISSGNVVGAIKNGFSLLKNKNVQRILLIGIIGTVMILVAVVASLLGVFNAVGNFVQDTIENVIGFFTVDENGAIEITDEQIDIIIDGIKDMGINIEDLKLTGDKIDENDPEAEEKNKEALRKYIRKFYEAQAVTQTLDYNLAKSPGKTYGTVKVYRANGEQTINKNSGRQLKYITYEEMQNKQTNKDVSIANNFSINDLNQLVVAEIRTTNTTDGNITNINLVKIDYKSVISQYTTSMNFFLYLAMITQNPEFVAEVTELVKDSEIHIMLMENSINETIVTKRTYTKNTKYASGIEPTAENKEESGMINNKRTELFPAITYVKTWFCEQTIEYKQTNESNEPKTSTTTPINQAEPEIPAGEEFVSWNTNDITTTIVTGNSKKYEETVRGDVLDRTGQKGDGKKSFIGLLDEKFKIPNSTRKVAAGGNLVSGAEMFFYLLQKDAESQNLEQIMRYVLYKYTGNDYGVTELDLSMFDAKEMHVITLTVGGNLSAFGTNLTREEFIQLVEAYNHGTNYDTYMKPYAGDFYDICTENNVNPSLAFAHACLETGYGSNSGCQNDKNYFGMAHYNGASSGSKYSTVADSIQDYCKWVINNATSGTSAYSSNCSVAQELATVEPKLNGTPDTNIYVLYCRYAQLSSTHDGKWGGPEWFTREVQGKQCDHESGSPTTVEEKAAYAVYTTDQRISIAKTIFGDNVFIGSLNFDGNTVEAAGYIFPHYLQADYAGSYGTSTIASSGCGPTSLAMLLAGLKGDASITPITVVENIKEYWPDGSYYVSGVGSSHCIFNNDFISKYYGITSQRGITPAQALAALESGYPVIGREEGHILAVVPAPDEYKSQGYKFYIMDSARGHDGPYKTHNDANAVVSGNLDFLAILMP